MYSLNDYADALISALLSERDKQKRRDALQSWIKLLKRHHRYLEIDKIISIIETKVYSQDKASITVSSQDEAKLLEDYFKSKGIKTEVELDPKVLGGARIIWDNMLVDNTLKLQLANLKKRLTQ